MCSNGSAIDDLSRLRGVFDRGQLICAAHGLLRRLEKLDAARDLFRFRGGGLGAPGARLKRERTNSRQSIIGTPRMGKGETLSMNQPLRAAPRLRVCCFAISIDGYGAGTASGPRKPARGRRPLALHEWVFPTRTFQEIHGGGAGAGPPASTTASPREAWTGSARGSSVGTCSGPVRGPWPDDAWKELVGGQPALPHAVFVLTHHVRAPIAMDGGRRFTSSPAASNRRSCRRRRRQTVRTSGSEGRRHDQAIPEGRPRR